MRDGGLPQPWLPRRKAKGYWSHSKAMTEGWARGGQGGQRVSLCHRKAGPWEEEREGLQRAAAQVKDTPAGQAQRPARVRVVGAQSPGGISVGAFLVWCSSCRWMGTWPPSQPRPLLRPCGVTGSGSPSWMEGSRKVWPHDLYSKIYRYTV